MKFLISESQFNLLLEQTAPFYSQPKDGTGRKNPNADYVLNQGGPIQKTQGDVDAKLLFPNGQFPKTISVKQMQDLFAKQKNQPIQPKLDPKIFEWPDKFKELEAILYYARDISWAEGLKKSLFNSKEDIRNFAIAIIAWAQKNKGYNPALLQAAITQIFRESKGTPTSFLSPKEMWGAITNIIGKDPVQAMMGKGWDPDHSQGYAQIKPSTAKEFGIDMSSLYTYGGSLDALYKMLKSNYGKAQRFYSGNMITIYDNNQLRQVNALGGDAALQMAVAAHNAGAGIINKWCETNQKGIAAPCSKEFTTPFSDKNIKAITNKSKPIENYFPNIGGVHKYMPQFRKAFDSMNNIGKIIPLAVAPEVQQTKVEKYRAANPNVMDPGKI